MEIQNNRHGMVQVSTGEAWGTGTGQPEAQMAPGVMEKFIVRINRDSTGDVSTASAGSGAWATPEVRGMGRAWDQSTETARFPKSCTIVLQADSQRACLPIGPGPLFLILLKLSFLSALGWRGLKAVLSGSYQRRCSGAVTIIQRWENIMGGRERLGLPAFDGWFRNGCKKIIPDWIVQAESEQPGNLHGRL